ncbi:hypothetical protein A4G99_03625 [Haladaptatus sp. R4]|nr:hypothetical protein A4G99_03625 [Haladaptatus sp. R4]
MTIGAGSLVGTGATKSAVRAADLRDASSDSENDAPADSNPDSNWTVTTSSTIYEPAAVSDEAVFAGSIDGFVYAIDRATGDERWTAQPNDQPKFTPVYADGMLYTRGNTTFSALDADSGSVVWSTTIEDGTSAEPVVRDGVVFVPSPHFDAPEKLYAFDAETGETRWTFKGDGCKYARGTPGVQFAGDELLLLDEKTLWKLDPDDASVLASYNYGKYDDFYRLATNGEMAYLSTSTDTPTDTLAIDVSDGSKRWMKSFGTDTPVHTISMDDTLYVSNAQTGDSRLFALDATTGDRRWRFDEPRGNVNMTRATVRGDAVFVGSERRVYGLDPSDGSERTHWETSASVTTTPVATEDAVYSTSHDFDGNGYVYSFERDE